MDALEKLIGPGRVDESPLYLASLAEIDRRKRPPVDMNHPEPGYYRVKEKGEWVPYHYLHEGGELYCCKGRKEEWLELDVAVERFSWAWDNPITKETYQTVMSGGRWPDLDETVEEQVSRRGDNNPPQDPLEQFKVDIENALAAVKRYEKIDDDQISKAAQSARARLNELSREADKKRVELKAPHLAAEREVDGSWNPLVKAAKAGADAIGRVMSAWENKKAKLQRDQEEAAQREADRAIATGTPPSAQEAPKPAPAQTPAPAMQIKGGYGRAASVTVEKVIETVTDYRALALFYIENPSVKSVIMHLAATDVKHGHEPPGVTIKDERKVR